MPAVVDKDSGGPFDKINEILIVAGVALAFAILLDSDEDLGEAGTHGRRDQDIANCLIPSGQSAVNEAAGRQQGVPLLYDVARKTKKIIHAWKMLVVILCGWFYQFAGGLAHDHAVFEYRLPAQNGLDDFGCQTAADRSEERRVG